MKLILCFSIINRIFFYEKDFRCLYFIAVFCLSNVTTHKKTLMLHIFQLQLFLKLLFTDLK